MESLDVQEQELMHFIRTSGHLVMNKYKHTSPYWGSFLFSNYPADILMHFSSLFDWFRCTKWKVIADTLIVVHGPIIFHEKLCEAVRTILLLIDIIYKEFSCHVLLTGLRKPREQFLLDKVSSYRRVRRQIFHDFIERLDKSDSDNKSYVVDIISLKEQVKVIMHDDLHIWRSRPRHSRTLKSKWIDILDTSIKYTHWYIYFTSRTY